MAQELQTQVKRVWSNGTTGHGNIVRNMYVVLLWSAIQKVVVDFGAHHVHHQPGLYRPSLTAISKLGYKLASIGKQYFCTCLHASLAADQAANIILYLFPI